MKNPRLLELRELASNALAQQPSVAVAAGGTLLAEDDGDWKEIDPVLLIERLEYVRELIRAVSEALDAEPLNKGGRRGEDDDGE